MKKSFKLNSKRFKLFLISLIAGIITVIYINESHIRRYLDLLTSESPKEHLASAEKSLEKRDIENSIKELDLAIESLSLIEDYSEKRVNLFIEKAISELENLKIEIKEGKIISDDFKNAYFKAYISTAYANIKLSELEIQDGTIKRSYEHFNNCSIYLKRGLKYVTESKKLDEKILIDEVNEILKALEAGKDLANFNFDRINRKMENLLN